jgi:hypothetical protein
MSFWLQSKYSNPLDFTTYFPYWHHCSLTTISSFITLSSYNQLQKQGENNQDMCNKWQTFLQKATSMHYSKSKIFRKNHNMRNFKAASKFVERNI